MSEQTKATQGNVILDMLVSRLRHFYVTRLTHLVEPEDEGRLNMIWMS